jgi:5-formyltetrahydrofolate cyclo-ligase
MTESFQELHCRRCSRLAETPGLPLHLCPSAPARKAELRRAVAASLATMSPAVHRQKSLLIARHVFELDAFQRASVIMAYVGLEMEVDPWLIVREAWARGKTVALPRIDPPLEDRRIARMHDRHILPFVLESQALDRPADHPGLRVDACGILEPGPGAAEVPAADIGLVFVPCIAFDRLGYRMGKGGGFYDRFLSRPDLTAVTVGLAFSEQVFTALPRCPYDRPVSQLVTETGTCDFRKFREPSA